MASKMNDDHVVVCVDSLMSGGSNNNNNNSKRMDGGCCSSSSLPSNECQGCVKKKDGFEVVVSQFVECRICQEEDFDNKMEIPCACSGSMKYAHRKCVQRWCNEKGDTTCEICQQTYKSGYTLPPRGLAGTRFPIDISGSWDFNDPRMLAMAAAERQLFEAEYDEYTSNSSCAACCRSVLLILMALLLLRHAFAISSAAGDEDFSTFFTLFLLRAAGFLLPCYIMARAMNILQRRRQRQEAAMTAAEVALLLEAGRGPGLRFPRNVSSNQ